MPTVLRSGPYRFYFYSHEPDEPPHIHIDRDDLSPRFWLDPIQLATNLGFRAHELRRNWKIAGGGYGIHWPEVDEDLSTEGLLRGARAPRAHTPSKT
jgi:hypothetical protein